MEKSEKVALLAGIVLVGFFIGVIFHYVLGFYLHLSYPFNTFLFNPDEAFGDFIKILSIIENFAPYSHPNSWMTYFPLVYIILLPFSFIKNRLIAYLIFASGVLSFLTFMNIKNLYAENLTKVQNFTNIFILTFMTYPILYALDRGNFDLFLFVLFSGFIYAFKKEKYFLSAVLLGIENAMKPFPFLFLILFLLQKRFKEFFLSLVISAVLIFGGFLILKGGFFDQIEVYIKNLIIFKKTWIYGDSANGLSEASSLFAALKFLLCSVNQIISINLLEKIYSYIGFIITVITIYFTCREKTYWKKVALLTLNMLLVSYVIIDYKLIFLLIPIWLFVNAEEKTKFDTAYTILFGLLLVSKKIFVFWIKSGHLGQLITYGVIINPLIMLVFMGLIIFEQFYDKKEVKLGN